MKVNERTHLKYVDARRMVRDGDLLLFRGWCLMSKIIRLGTQSPYSHAAMAVWSAGELRLVEVISWHGGREISLFDQVVAGSGMWDVYHANPEGRWKEFDAARAVAAMRKFVDCDYGWANLLAASAIHMAGLRFFLRPDRNDQRESNRPPFCSEAVVRATRAAGVDPVPNLADRFTEPHHLSESAFYQYRFTLIA